MDGWNVIAVSQSLSQNVYDIGIHPRYLIGQLGIFTSSFLT